MSEPFVISPVYTLSDINCNSKATHGHQKLLLEAVVDTGGLQFSIMKMTPIVSAPHVLYVYILQMS